MHSLENEPIDDDVQIEEFFFHLAVERSFSRGIVNGLWLWLWFGFGFGFGGYDRFTLLADRVIHFWVPLDSPFLQTNLPFALPCILYIQLECFRCWGWGWFRLPSSLWVIRGASANNDAFDSKNLQIFMDRLWSFFVTFFVGMLSPYMFKNWNYQMILWMIMMDTSIGSSIHLTFDEMYCSYVETAYVNSFVCSCSSRRHMDVIYIIWFKNEISEWITSMFLLSSMKYLLGK